MEYCILTLNMMSVLIPFKVTLCNGYNIKLKILWGKEGVIKCNLQNKNSTGKSRIVINIQNSRLQPGYKQIKFKFTKLRVEGMHLWQICNFDLPRNFKIRPTVLPTTNYSASCHRLGVPRMLTRS